MNSNINVGQTVRVTIRFIDFNQNLGTDDLLDPTTVEVSLYKFDQSTSAYILVATNLTPIIHDSLGIYYYDWTTSEDGLFKLLFIGTLEDATPSTIENPRDFFVGTASPSITLGHNQDFYFLSELDPLYIDPSIILTYFPDGDIVEITEIVYRLSLQLQLWFGENLELTPLMEQFLIAATLCELTKIYPFGGSLDGFGNANSFTLGDLQVDKGTGASNKLRDLYTGNAANWCELAALLKNQLMQTKVSGKPYVRGSNFCNPIPNRRIRRFE